MRKLSSGAPDQLFGGQSQAGIDAVRDGVRRRGANDDVGIHLAHEGGHVAAGQNLPALAAFDGWFYMVYTDANGAQLWVTRSSDGTNWIDTQPIQGQSTDVPALASFGGALFIVYSDSGSSQLWESWLDQPHSGGGP